MGNTIFTKDRSVRNRLEAIQKLKPPMTGKGCRCFVGMVNLLCLSCPEFQKLLKPIYNLTRKGRQFTWGEEQEEAFDELKRRLSRLPVVHLPDNKGICHLYSDTNTFATGSALYQI